MEKDQVKRLENCTEEKIKNHDFLKKDIRRDMTIFEEIEILKSIESDPIDYLDDRYASLDPYYDFYKYRKFE